MSANFDVFKGAIFGSSTNGNTYLEYSLLGTMRKAWFTNSYQTDSWFQQFLDDGKPSYSIGGCTTDCYNLNGYFTALLAGVLTNYASSGTTLVNVNSTSYTPNYGMNMDLDINLKIQGIGLTRDAAVTVDFWLYGSIYEMEDFYQLFNGATQLVILYRNINNITTVMSQGGYTSNSTGYPIEEIALTNAWTHVQISIGPTFEISNRAMLKFAMMQYPSQSAFTWYGLNFTSISSHFYNGGSLDVVLGPGFYGKIYKIYVMQTFISAYDFFYSYPYTKSVPYYLCESLPTFPGRICPGCGNGAWDLA